MNSEQEAYLARAANQLLTWSTAEALIATVGHDIKLAGADNLTVLPRILPGNRASPLICHLLNSNYDAQSDSYHKQRNMELTIGADMLGRVYQSATLFAPGQAPVVIERRASDRASAITIPDMDMWTILKLE